MDEVQVNKAHRGKKSGTSAEKKQAKKIAKSGGQDMKGKNPKAFAITNPVRFEKEFRRAADIKNKRLHIPVADRSTEYPPPLIVAVVGPPKVGKTTLIKSLVKFYTKQNIGEIRGPVTLAIGKKKRVSFFECPSDLSGMMDLAKVADIILLVIDASFGFEMETFEFLNILQTHGFPKIIGVLNHLDKYKTGKQIQNVKKAYKRRFWEEIYHGAKLYNLSGLISGSYSRMEIMNLARFITSAKVKALTWRSSHSYMLVDRIEDITEPETVRLDKYCDRTICFYGYVRGLHLKPNVKVHIPGSGDYDLASVTPLGDPCPPPAKATNDKQRKLESKQKIIYAPMSDINNIDAIYVDIQKPNLNFTDLEGEESTQGPGEQMMKELHRTTSGIDEKLQKGRDGFSIFAGMPAADDDEEMADGDAEEAKNGKTKKEEVVNDNGRVRRKVIFSKDIVVSDGEDDNGDDSDDDII